jgi:hypothetical protein
VVLVLSIDLVLFVAPLLVFTDKLWASRTGGMGSYQSLAARYVVEFETKWSGDVVPAGERLMGAADIQSLADLDRAVRVVKEMRWVPVGPRLLSMMTITGIVPFVPLLLFQYPITELAQKVLSKLIGF